MEQKHILLCGERGAGKSTLIRRLLACSTRPLAGFFTERLSADETGFHPIYLHPAGEPYRYEKANLLALCDARTHEAELAVFNGLGADCLYARPAQLIVMDELGFLEAGAERFTRAVMQALDGDVPVLAAVKARFDVPFLNAVRAHPNAVLYTVTPENREGLYQTLLPAIAAWNARE